MRPKANQLDALTGLRFIAALLVFVHHIGNKFGMPHVRGCLGALAVSFFFVLSGFILTYVYHGRLERGGIKRFYVTRWARIWPLHFVCLLLVLFVTGRWNLINVGEQPLKLLLNGALMQSWIPLRPYVFSFNGVSWSISTELFFYFLFPFFLIGGQRKFWLKYGGVLLFAVAMICALQVLSNVPVWANNLDFVHIIQANPLLRLPEFCTGMAVGHIFLNRRAIPRKQNLFVDSAIESVALGSLVAYGMAFAIFRPDALVANATWGGAIPGAWVRFSGGAIVFATAVYVFATRQGIWSKLLSTRIMVFMGEVSFAFYMTHMIVIQMVNRYDWIASPIPGWSLVLGCFIIALCLSTLLFKLVEVPAKNAILECYDGSGWKSLMSAAAATIELFRQPVNIAAVTTIFCVVVFLNQAYRPIVFSSQVANLVNETEAVFGNVNFGESVRLIGFKMEENAEGIQLNMVWQKLGDVARPRFIHVCDATGKPIVRFHHNLRALAEAHRGDSVVDTIQLTRRQLTGGAAIGVGFFSQEHGSAALQPGPRTTGKWRFTLVNKQEFRDRIQLPNATSPFRNVSFGKSRQP